MIAAGMAFLAVSCFDSPNQRPTRAVDDNSMPAPPDTSGLRSRKPAPETPEPPADKQDTLRPGIALASPD